MFDKLIKGAVDAVGGLIGGGSKSSGGTQIIQQPNFSGLMTPVHDVGSTLALRRYADVNQTRRAETASRRGYEDQAPMYEDDPIGLARMWADLLTLDSIPERNQRKYARGRK